jgi:glycine cleavage system H protein
MNLPDDLYYSPEHFWVRDEGKGRVTLGITDFAQKQLGNLIFIDLPEVEDEIEADEEMGAVESAKSVSDLISPVSGKIIDVNQEVINEPTLVNDSPYTEGWMVVVELSDPDQLKDLDTAEDYESRVDNEEEE